jgi:hypothetical protein
MVNVRCGVSIKVGQFLDISEDFHHDQEHAGTCIEKA